MRAIPTGFEARLDVIVTEDMTVDFTELGRVHPVYATYWMARHVEEAARKIILGFLDEDEDGIGVAVSVRHVAPVLPGTRLTIVAEHTRTERGRVFASCRVLAGEDGTLAGEGSTEQAILPRDEIAARFDQLRARRDPATP